MNIQIDKDAAERLAALEEGCSVTAGSLSVLPDTVTKWIPEAPEFPGVYANLSDKSGQGKIHDDTKLQPSTRNIYAARMFDTEAECAAWCEANSYPAFVPRSHGFMGAI